MCVPTQVRPALRQFTLEALAERDTPEGRTSVRLRQQAEARMEEVRRARVSEATYTHTHNGHTRAIHQGRGSVMSRTLVTD